MHTRKATELASIIPCARRLFASDWSCDVMLPSAANDNVKVAEF